MKSIETSLLSFRMLRWVGHMAHVRDERIPKQLHQLNLALLVAQGIKVLIGPTIAGGNVFVGI